AERRRTRADHRGSAVWVAQGQPDAVLRPRRSRRGARRSQRPALRQSAGRLRASHTICRRHPQPRDHGPRRRPVRCEHGRRRSLEDLFDQAAGGGVVRMILSRWFKLDKGAEKSREGVFARLASVFEQPRPIDDDLWSELEDLLLEADVGVKTTDQLLEILHNEVELGNAANSKDLYRVLQEELVLSMNEVKPASPDELLAPRGELGVVLVVGVNGVGKTTSIAKLAAYY